MGVIYLAWLPYGIEYFKVFIDSYIRYNACCPHQLVIVFNGRAAEHLSQPAEYQAYVESKAVKVDKYLYFQQGQDIDIYRQAAAQIETEFVLFFNTYSELKAACWLRHYTQHFDAATGIIGASGSLQSYYSSVFQKHNARWEPAKGFLYNFRKYKLFVKAFLYWRFLFKPFPNPSIRTNAFMVRRLQFLKINYSSVDTKFKAYQFESGRRSITRFYQQQGLAVLVIDRNGKAYSPAEWKRSSTFWINEQENLLVADNQTRLYTNATITEKNEMTRLAWGNA